MRQLLAIWIFAPVVAVAAQANLTTPIYKDATAPVDARVSDLVSRMSLLEKIELVGGNSFSTKANSRLGIPELKMTDGPIGVRWGQATAFPAGISMGASFNRKLVYDMAEAMAIETRAKGRDMLLGPCVGLARIPFGGRNFESMGEDPFLTAELTAEYTRALNAQNVLGSVKHFGLNDQEYERMTINSVADERTMHELHFVPFERAVQEGIGTVMSSYNKLNGQYASENKELLTGILKQQWGFKGFVVSDWGAVHSTIPTALAGTDLEMPTPLYFNEVLHAAVLEGKVPESLMNDKVSRILGQIFRIGLFDGADTNRPPLSVVNSASHKEVALKMARESMVLLKNENNILPIDLSKVKRIAVIGPNADVYVAGGGSSMLHPPAPVTVLQGMKNRVGSLAQVGFSAGIISPGTTIAAPHMKPAVGSGIGLYAEYYNNRDLTGIPAFSRIEPTVNFYYDVFTRPAPGVNSTNYSVRWTGWVTAPVPGTYEIQTTSDDGIRLWIDDQLVIDNWNEHGSITDTVKLTWLKGQTYKIRLEYFQSGGGSTIRLGWTPPGDQLSHEAIDLAAQSDLAILTVGFNSDMESEGNDRATMDLPVTHLDLMKKVVAANPNTVIIINTGNPVAMGSWINSVPAIVYAWYPGEEGGNALADILLGAYDPSGRLPITMLKRWEDSPAFGTYPEVNDEVHYKEGIFLGYRHFDRANLEPQYPFGYGLSYTKFIYSNMKVTLLNATAKNPSVELSVDVTNAGARPGKEVVQLYVNSVQPKIERPVQELKGFEKIALMPGQTRTVTFKLDLRSFAYYDVATKGWVADPGAYTLRVGSHSRDIRLIGTVDLLATR